jgi:hypothetical protein
MSSSSPRSRAEGSQRKLAEAHATLDMAEALIAPELARPWMAAQSSEYGIDRI